MPPKANTETFIAKGRELYGDEYDYSKVVYTRKRDKIIIICKTHGEFLSTPEYHTSKTKRVGCPKCGVIKCHKPLNASHFRNRASVVHGGRYDYSEVIYINTRTRVTIICPQHGAFIQTPDKHYRGRGCPTCGKGGAKDINHFLERAKEAHGERYDYSKSVYVSSDTPLTIICSEHGEFTQAPKHHYGGQGCAICGARWSARRYNDVPTRLYYVKVESSGLTGWKIGITTKSVEERFKLETRNGASIKLLDEIMFKGGREAFDMEQDILRVFKGQIHRFGRSMLLDGGTEVFESDVLGGSIPAL